MEMYMITVAETGAFRDQVESLLSEDEKFDLITYLSLNPGAGVLVQGTGGIRNLRWAGFGRGKSGGIRVLYYFHSENMPLYLLATFGKNERANISMKEARLLASLVKQLKRYWS
jgi:mRNA-degrading endonuclease RelE of RelBE toxin-antitoxin system